MCLADKAAKASHDVDFFGRNSGAYVSQADSNISQRLPSLSQRRLQSYYLREGSFVHHDRFFRYLAYY
jgi:hypothetical protein